MAVTAASAVRVAPIGADDLRRVAALLHANLNSRVSVDHWARAADAPWEVESPNAGFMLLDGDEVVGAQLAFYSERSIDGRRERFCNLGAWCVLPEYRFHSLRLLKAALGQQGYHFTDLSPSGNVVDINPGSTSAFSTRRRSWPPTFPGRADRPRRDQFRSGADRTHSHRAGSAALSGPCDRWRRPAIWF